MYFGFKNNFQGFSLLELLLVVAVGSVLILAGLGTYRLVAQQSYVNDASNLIGAIISQTEGKFTPLDMNTYPADTDITAVMSDLNIFPKKSLNNAGLPVHPWGGDITVLTAEAAAVSILYRIQLHDIPDESVCIELSQLYDYNNSDKMHSYRINGVIVNDTSLANVSALCRAAGRPINFVTIAVRL